MRSKTGFSVILALIMIMICPLGLLWAGNRPVTSNTMVNWKIRQAVEKGHRYLVSRQDPKEGYFGKGRYKVHAIAITSFACLSLMASGNLPNRGPYGKNVEAGLEYILSCVNISEYGDSVTGSGYITEQDEKSRMHGHGYATLFLAEVYGTTSDPKLRRRLEAAMKKSVELILESQSAVGGWGYFPNSGAEDHEGSITVCQLQALRAARNVGIRVPKAHIERALEYLRRSANPDGTFKYRLGMPASRKSFPLAAAGVSSLNATGEYDNEITQKGLEFMMQYLPPKDRFINDQYYRAFYYYGHFYAAQAMYQAPTHYWEKWFPAVSEQLLTEQSPIGSWGERDSKGHPSKYGPAYATAITTLILQIPYNYLPIFQR